MESELILRTVSARVHGRYLVRPPRTTGPWPAVFSFHGYGEDAETNMTALQRIPQADDWLLVAVQALHPFYTKNERVVASWMTRQDRELAIADNAEYMRGVVDGVQREFPLIATSIVFAGFSQGGAMAYRAAAHLPSAGVIVLAADVPPDVASPCKLPTVLIGRGTMDSWYSDEKMTADLERLRNVAARVETCVFTGGHEWTDAFAAAAGEFLYRHRQGLH